jgi:predicted amidophosphoribosyltransferase
MAEHKTCPNCGREQWQENGSWYCFVCGKEVLQVTHKNVTFTQDANRPNRLNFAGNSVDVPGRTITEMKAYKDAIIIGSGNDKYKFIFDGAKDWLLIDITPQ